MLRPYGVGLLGCLGLLWCVIGTLLYVGGDNDELSLTRKRKSLVAGLILWGVWFEWNSRIFRGMEMQ